MVASSWALVASASVVNSVCFAPRVLHDDNDASLPGLLLRLGKFYEKTGYFKTYFANRTVLLSNGMTAV